MIVWLASYPRSGNTFVRILIRQCLGFETYSVYGEENDIAPDEKNRALTGAAVLPTGESRDSLRESEQVYFIKTHGRFEPDMKNDRIIYIIRDGREATESYFRYARNFGNVAFSRFELIAGTRFAPSWGSHVEDWLAHGAGNVTVIRFEYMIAEPLATIRGIATEIEATVKDECIPGFQELNEMNPKFYSSGRTDTWYESWSGEEEGFFWYKNGRVMEKYGYRRVTPDGSQGDLSVEMAINHEFNALRSALLQEMRRSTNMLLSGLREEYTKSLREHLEGVQNRDEKEARPGTEGSASDGGA